jgi:hypothetical protein
MDNNWIILTSRISSISPVMMIQRCVRMCVVLWWCCSKLEWIDLFLTCIILLRYGIFLLLIFFPLFLSLPYYWHLRIFEYWCRKSHLHSILSQNWNPILLFSKICSCSAWKWRTTPYPGRWKRTWLVFLNIISKTLDLYLGGAHYES